jgi:recombinational DNA repair protein (RecF pathway)
MNEMPTQKSNEEILMDGLRSACAKYIKNLAEGCHDEDDAHYVFEAALEMLYGADVWEWVNGNFRNF